MNLSCLLQGDFGVYTKWVNENFNPNSTSAVKYEALINSEYQAGRIDRETALKVYNSSIAGEAAFFGSV